MPNLETWSSSDGDGVVASLDTLGNMAVASLTVAGAGLPSTSNIALKPGALETEVYVSKNGSDSHDGLSWGSAFLTAAKGFSSLPNGGRLRFGNGQWNESNLTLPATGGNIHVSGQGSSKTVTAGDPGYTVLFTGYGDNIHVNGGGDLFACSTGSYSNVVFEDIAFGSYPGGGSTHYTPPGGHIFNLTNATVSAWVMHRVSFNQASPGEYIWYINGGAMLSCWFHDFFASVSPGSGGWYVSGTGNSQNDLAWENFRHNALGAATPAFYLANIGTTGWSQDLVIRNACFEQTTGGNVHVEGFRYITLENHVTYDLPTARTDGTSSECTTYLNSTTVLDSAAVSGDNNKTIAGPNIPNGTYITAVQSGTGYTISNAATAAGSSLTFLIQAVVNDMYYIGQTPGTNLACDKFALKRIMRTSGSMGTGLYDINCLYIYSGLLEQCAGAINFSNNPIITINCDGATYYNRPLGSPDVSAGAGIVSTTLGAGGGTGAAAQSRLVGGGTTTGHPTTGTWNTLDIYADPAGVVWTCTGGGTPGTWSDGSITTTLADNGLLIANAPIASMGAAITPTAGYVMLVRMNVHRPVTVSYLMFGVSAVGSGTSTGTFAGIYSSAGGAPLTGSADMASSFTSGAGITSCLLTTPQPFTPGQWFWGALLLNLGTTQPGLYGLSQGACLNYGLAISVTAFGAYPTSGQTSLPSITPSLLSLAFSHSLWIGGK